MQPNPISESPANLALLRLPQVKAQTGLSRSELYRHVAIGCFPAPIKIGERSSAWSSVEIERWIAERIAQRDAKTVAGQWSMQGSMLDVEPTRKKSSPR